MRWSPKIRVRTRLPISAWIIAGLLTLFSVTSSLTHFTVAPSNAVYANISEGVSIFSWW